MFFEFSQFLHATLLHACAEFVLRIAKSKFPRRAAASFVVSAQFLLLQLACLLAALHALIDDAERPRPARRPSGLRPSTRRRVGDAKRSRSGRATPARGTSSPS